MISSGYIQFRVPAGAVNCLFVNQKCAPKTPLHTGISDMNRIGAPSSSVRAASR
jgi:hypothetical protein